MVNRLRRLKIINSLSDVNRVRASNQFPLPFLTYLMWTQHWPDTELRSIDREVRNIIRKTGGKHPLSSTAVMYLSRDNGDRGLRSVEQEYKLSRIKAAVKLYQNPDSSLKTFQMFEEKAAEKEHSSLDTQTQQDSSTLSLQRKRERVFSLRNVIINYKCNTNHKYNTHHKCNTNHS